MKRSLHIPSLAVVSLIWLIVNAVLFYKNGVKVVADSERYLEYADSLVQGFSFDPHNFWYIGYAFYLIITFKLFGSIAAVIVGQYLLSFVAVIALYKAASLLWDSWLSAMITCLLMIGFVDVQTWNSYVLTESVYTSFTCFSIYCLVRIHKGKVNSAFIVLTVFVILFTAFIKPTGIAFPVATAAVLLYKIRNVVYRAGLISVAFVLFILLINRMLTTYLVIENYQAGEVIYAVTTYSDQEIVKNLVVERPHDLFIPDSSSPPVVRVLSFIFHHPLYWTKLFLLKVYYLLFHTRPFWSVTHNIFSLVVLISSYFLFFVALRSKDVDRQIVIFALTFVLVHVLSIGITSDDWDGRFLIPMLPLIFMFSGHGAAVLRPN